MLRLVFGWHIKFHRENGFQTPGIPFPFMALSDHSGHKEGMVRQEGELSNLLDELEDCEAQLKALGLEP